jgi:Glutathione S-transferase, N-terminal domain
MISMAHRRHGSGGNFWEAHGKRRAGFRGISRAQYNPLRSSGSLIGCMSRDQSMQRLPALLLDDGTVIAESIAICRYFEGNGRMPEQRVPGVDCCHRIAGSG